MNVTPPDQVVPENWVDEIEKAFWGLVADWKAKPRDSEQCARDFERVLLEFKRPPNALRCLSAKQAKVIALRMRGLSPQEIGHRLNCSTKTVDAHIHQAKRRLGLRSLTEVVLYGAKHKLVSFDEL